MKPRIGVYTCHCGLNIANTVDVEAVTSFALGLPNVETARDYTYMCSDPGQAMIVRDILDLALTHVVVASCSPRMHEPTFRAAIEKAGLNPYCLEMANIREQCSWVHADRARATAKAMDLIAAAVGKVAWLVPLRERNVGVTEAALVIGGGIAGMQAAIDIAEAGFKVYLVEREPYLGGRALQLNTTFPTLERMSDLIAPFVDQVTFHPNIESMTGAQVKRVDGFIGNFRVGVTRYPRFVDPDKCTACGKCVEACPVSVPDQFNADLVSRRAIYQLPNSSSPRSGDGKQPGVLPFVIDEHACMFVQDHVCNPSLTEPELAPYSMEQELHSCSADNRELNSHNLPAKEYNARGARTPKAGPGAMGSFANAKNPTPTLPTKRGAVGVATDVPCAAACPEQAIDLSLLEHEVELEVGTIIVATGATTFEAIKAPELGFGAYPNVITSLQFERLAHPQGPTHGKIVVDGREPKDVAFIQCVGSRDRSKGNEYCSRVCCMVAAKQAYLIKEDLPDANVSVMYTDMRAFGKGHEEFYDQVRKSGVRYRRGYVSEVYRRADKLIVRFEDTLNQKPSEVAADLVVLGIGLGPRVETNEIASLLGLSRSADGFLAESHPKLRPVETMVDGVFLAGTCQGPKDIVDTISQARAAASSALAPLCRGHVKIESATSFIDQEMCAGCGLCAAACAYGALTLNERTHRMRVNEVLCKGCGACAAACPSKAIQVMQFTPRQVLSQVAALV